MTYNECNPTTATLATGTAGPPAATGTAATTAATNGAVNARGTAAGTATSAAASCAETAVSARGRLPHQDCATLCDSTIGRTGRTDCARSPHDARSARLTVEFVIASYAAARTTPSGLRCLTRFRFSYDITLEDAAAVAPESAMDLDLCPTRRVEATFSTTAQTRLIVARETGRAYWSQVFGLLTGEPGESGAAIGSGKMDADQTKMRPGL